MQLMHPDAAIQDPLPAWCTTRSRIYWYDQYALNEQDTAFARYDPDRIAAELLATGADVIALYAANQQSVAYYPSAIWPQHPNLQGRDYVGELMARLRPAGKKILLYINWLDSKHAEWNVQYLDHDPAAQRTEQPLASWADPAHPNGRVQTGHWQLPCLNSPKREQVVAIARELCARYQPDAFHLDMVFTTDICVCNYCRPHLEKICGTRDISRAAVHANWAAYIDWYRGCSASLIGAVSAVLREHGVIAAHNAFMPLFQPALRGVDEGWLPALDVYVSECFDAFHMADTNAASITVRWQHAVGKPAWILRTSHPMYYAHWPITQAQWQLYAAACKANGAALFGPCGVGARPDTTSAKRLLANVRAGFDAFMQDDDLAPRAMSAARVALVFSWATRRYFEPESNRWSEELYGWARFLIEEHLPFDIVVAERVQQTAALARYDLVILPDLSNLADAFCNMLNAYVHDGGRVLATGATSLRDDHDVRRSDFGLAGLFGVRHCATHVTPLAVEQPDEPVPAAGTFQVVAPAGATVQRYYVSVDPAGSVSGSNDPLPMQRTDWPAEVRHVCGKGQAGYISFDIGRYYNQHGDEHIGAWMQGTLDSLLPSRQIATNAPRTVELTIWRQSQPACTIIHLANRSVPWTLATYQRQITEILPVHDVEITLASPYDDVQVSCRGADVTVIARNPALCVRIAVLHDYAAVVLRPARAT